MKMETTGLKSIILFNFLFLFYFVVCYNNASFIKYLLWEVMLLNKYSRDMSSFNFYTNTMKQIFSLSNFKNEEIGVQSNLSKCKKMGAVEL
jgi:hypothetical protein